MSRKALILAPQPFFSPRGTPFSVYYRTLILAEQGVQADLLTYGQGEDVDIPGVRIIRIPGFRFLGKVRTGPSALKAFLDVFMFLWTVGLLVRHRYAFVHAHEEAVFYCRFLKPVFGFKLVYDMHSSLPQQLENFDFTKSKLVKRIFTGLENASLRKADAIITICPDLADYVTGVIGEDSRHQLVENSIFEPVRLARTSQADESGASSYPVPEDRRLVIYAGTFEKYQGLDLLIPAFAIAQREVPQAFLLMVGGDPDQVEEMEALAKQAGCGVNVLFTGRVPQSVARRFNSISDVLTSPRSAGTNTPLKVYEQLASGKPLVATRIYSHTQVLSDENTFLVEPDVEDMARGIVSALTDDQAISEKVAAAVSLYESAYSRQAYVKKITRLLELLE